MGRVKGAGLASPAPVGKFEHRKKKRNRQPGDTLLCDAQFAATHIRRLGCMSWHNPSGKDRHTKDRKHLYPFLSKSAPKNQS